MLIAAIAFANDKGKPSQKTLIAAIQASSVQNPGDIIYWRERPFSARFYSQGQALLVKTPEALANSTNNKHQNFLVTKIGALKGIPDEIKQQFTFVKRYRNWEYWLQKPQSH